MAFTPSLIQAALIAAGVIGPGSGRTGANVAAVVALISAVIGGRALARSAGRVGTGMVAVVLGLTGVGLAGLHLATNTGAIGTGSGRLGAFVAVVLALIGIGLGGLSVARSRRAG